jgi:DNA-binding transcriptional regulator YhcF (GntR family)
MRLHKYQQIAALVRAQIADGILPPGAPAPSGAALSRMTDCSVLTCRRALRALIADGTLVPGVSRNARLRVPAADRHGQTHAEAKRALSRALAEHRRAAGLTQPQLAELIGLSVTTVGHAETGRVWQSRPFWELADKALDADGELLRLHDACRAAEVSSEEPTEAEETMPQTDGAPAETACPESPAVVTVDVPGPVSCITITWSDGAVTTVRPPGPAEDQRQNVTS